MIGYYNKVEYNQVDLGETRVSRLRLDDEENASEKYVRVSAGKLYAGRIKK